MWAFVRIRESLLMMIKGMQIIMHICGHTNNNDDDCYEFFTGVSQ